ncbi:MAG: DUF3782 domain-containing protein [Magnetococcales bacterium]|nr:DUF3782 domain-containing protein [Magnetococcales bacterium]
MSETVTFDDVWKMFQEMVRENRERSAETDRQLRAMRETNERLAQETARLVQENERRAQENERRVLENERLAQESARRAQEDERRAREAERLAREAERLAREEDERLAKEERERRAQELDRQFKESDRKLQESMRMVDNLTGKWGKFLEGLVAPACQRLFAQRGIPVHEVHPRVRTRTDDGASMEIDLLVVNQSAVVLVEVKSTLGVPDVKRHLKRLAQFKTFFPRYADCTVYGAVIGIDSEEFAEAFAANEGLFVLTHGSDDVAIANPPEFVPRTW